MEGWEQPIKQNDMIVCLFVCVCVCARARVRVCLCYVETVLTNDWATRGRGALAEALPLQPQGYCGFDEWETMVD